MMPIAPGRTYLKVTGIICIILGGITTFVSLIALLGTVYLYYVSGSDLELLEELLEMQVLPEDLTAYFVAAFASVALLLIIGVFLIVIGILGIVYRDRLEKAKLLFILAAVYLGYATINAIVALATSSFGFMNLVYMIVPVCYFVGASKNHNEYKNRENLL